MKIYRPLWSEGAFLAPQQFQQQTRWDAYVADVVAHMSLSSPWGVISAEFDESALTVSRLNPVNLVVRFPDGTLVDTGISDNLPPACDLSHLTGYSSVDIVLALPLLSANGGNLSSGNGVSRPCRWQQEWLPVQDLSGQERTDMAVLRHAITLRYAHDDNSAYLTCPVACLTRNAQGQWELGRDFLPPSLSLSASPLLINSLSDLVHRIQARDALHYIRHEGRLRVCSESVPVMDGMHPYCKGLRILSVDLSEGPVIGKRRPADVTTPRPPAFRMPRQTLEEERQRRLRRWMVSRRPGECVPPVLLLTETEGGMD